MFYWYISLNCDVMDFSSISLFFLHKVNICQLFSPPKKLLAWKIIKKQVIAAVAGKGSSNRLTYYYRIYETTAAIGCFSIF